jgi:hypothetical protein
VCLQPLQDGAQLLVLQDGIRVALGGGQEVEVWDSSTIREIEVLASGMQQYSQQACCWSGCLAYVSCTYSKEGMPSC